MPGEHPLLNIENLTIEFNTQDGIVKAVNKLSYSLKEGETLGIVGESGSGKSVSSLGIIKLIPNPPGKVVEGRILFQGKNLTLLAEKEMRKIRGNEISMIFQEPMTSLNPIMTCGRQIAESLILHRNMKKKEALAKAVDLMKSVGIADPQRRAGEYPHQMSGGMRQRIMIAMALACKPKLLICDEPTTALDVTIQAQILDLIRKLNKETGTAVIMITHDLGVVCELCERVMVMYTGKIMEQARAEQLFANPLHPYTEGLLKAIPKIEKERTPLYNIDGTVPNPMEHIEGCSFWPRCKYALDKCRTSAPPLFSLVDDRYVACWKYENQTTQAED